LIRRVWTYGPLIYSLIRRHFHLRYRQSFARLAWALPSADQAGYEARVLREIDALNGAVCRRVELTTPYVAESHS
jgi:hypothetical protein